MRKELNEARDKAAKGLDRILASSANADYWSEKEDREDELAIRSYIQQLEELVGLSERFP